MIVKRGDVYFADLSPVVGSEQGGVRPVRLHELSGRMPALDGAVARAATLRPVGRRRRGVRHDQRRRRARYADGDESVPREVLERIHRAHRRSEPRCSVSGAVFRDVLQGRPQPARRPL